MLVRVNRNGRETRVNQKVADVLLKRGIVTRADAPAGATYLTKVMVPAAAIAAPVTKENDEGEAVEDGLDAMSLEELHALAKERDITVHHRAGKQTVIKALRA